MKAWVMLAVAFSLLASTAYADNTISMYMSATSGYQGMPLMVNFAYSGVNFSNLIAGWGTASGVCNISCQTYYGSFNSISTNVPSYSGTVYFVVTAYDSNGDVLATISTSFSINYQQTYQSCVPQFLSTYECLGNQLQQLYQNSNCNTQWTTVQTCTNGCFSPDQNVGYCMGGQQIVCQPNILACNGNYVQQCNSQGNGWSNIQYCSNGCNNGVCYSSASSCTGQYVDSQTCAGNFISQNYQYPDCTISQRITEFCPNGCLEGTCLPVAGKSAVQLDTSYPVKACDITPITFTVMNNGDTSSDFTINVSGDAGPWIHAPSIVTLDKGDQKTSTALVSPPCDATGTKAFSISVTGATGNTQNSVLSIEGTPQPAYVPTPSILSFVALAAIVVAGALAYKSGMFKKRKPTRCREYI